MRILQVSSATTIGGGEVHVIDLCQALQQRGHDVQLAARPGSPLVERLVSRSVPCHHLPLRNSLDIDSAVRLSHLIQQHQIDIVHGHVARDYLVCALARRLAGRSQLVLTRHHYLPIKGHWGYRKMFRQVGKVIAVSESVRRGLMTSLDLTPDQVITIPNWVNLDDYRERPDSLRARARFGVRQPLVVGMVGQMTPAKGQEEFIRAAALVASWRDDVAFLVAGEEEERGLRFTERLRQLIGELSVSDRVHFLGRVEDLPWLFAALTVLVLPSWQEAFSIVLIQAMAAGLPVIASDVGGPAEIVTHGVTGLLVPPRRVEALAQAINRLLDDPDLRRRLGVAARKEVVIRFEREKVINQIESVYRDVVSRP